MCKHPQKSPVVAVSLLPSGSKEVAVICIFEQTLKVVLNLSRMAHTPLQIYVFSAAISATKEKVTATLLVFSLLYGR